MKTIIKIRFVFFLLFAMAFTSCKKFLEIPPPKDAIKPEQIFENNETATSAMTGIYSRMAVSTSAFSGGTSSVAVINGLAADEFKSHNASFDEFYKNEISTVNSTNNSLWTEAFKYIYTSNAILEGLLLSKGVTEDIKKQIEGEAKFVRAFCYFYLLNSYGEVPLNLTTDYRINEIAGRSSKEKIYTQIIADLIDAEMFLSPNYISNERVRPNQWAAKALLSRIYLYTEKWDLAAQKATEIINQKPMYSLVDDMDKVFLKNSTEAVWQLMPTAGSNTPEGAFFILTATPTFTSLSPDFMSKFESGDNRRVKWVGEYSNTSGKYYYPFKYKIRTTTATTGIVEYSMVIRLSELYLIRAEARINSNDIPTGIADLNILRKRARALPTIATPNPLPDILLTLSKADALLAVEKERRMELFSEWGHRWLDLKRTNRAIPVLAPLKGATWQNTDVLYPIPENERSRNPNMGQNLGY
jgi:hypothetical protein